MSKSHSPRFEAIVADAKTRIREITIDEVRKKQDAGERFFLVDVREESEWAKGHVPGAMHIGRGVLERDVDGVIGDTAAEVVLYCGGGYRSALAAENLERMGYENVTSLAGGFREWTDRALPVEHPQDARAPH